MLRTTTLLIVMLLAGGPTGSLICESWCGTPAADAHHRAAGCHDAYQAAPKGQQLARYAGCHDATGMAPFVAEARQTESGHSEYVAAAVTFVQPRSTVHHSNGNAAVWSVFNGPSPHVPVSRPVLRV